MRAFNVSLQEIHLIAQQALSSINNKILSATCVVDKCKLS